MNIEELSSRLQDLSVQRTYAEEALEEITQESARVELQLRVARSAGRRNKETKITDKSDTNNFRVGDLVRITNRYRANEYNIQGNVTKVSPCYVTLLNTNTGATIRRHWRNLALVTAKTSQ